MRIQKSKNKIRNKIKFRKQHNQKSHQKITKIWSQKTQELRPKIGLGLG